MMLISAHSFYLRQRDQGRSQEYNQLQAAISQMLVRIQNLSPIDNDVHDKQTCDAMREMLNNADINLAQLAAEINSKVKKNWLQRKLGRVIPYFDKKVDIAIEAAASAATKQMLGGGP